jgi:glutamate-ammonia-ligase adenylyltransferase
VAGDRVLGERIIQIIQSFVYERPFGQEQVEEMNLIRLRMEKELARESDVEWDLKVGRGGIVDIEFLVEYQQIPANVRIPSTIAAMKCLGVAEELLEYYEFLRNVESGLRLWSPLASTRIEPKDHRALAVMLNVEEFAAEYRRVTGRVREIYDTKKSGVRSQEPE